MKGKTTLTLSFLSGVLVIPTDQAFAQPSGARSSNSERAVIEEVIVTGSSMRGDVATGTKPIILGEEDISATGAMSGTMLLTNLPQMGSFGEAETVKGRAGTNDNTNSPNIRSLPEGGGGSPTLLLIDGHRIVGAGVRQVAPDADVLPPLVLDRVEVLADGGSSIYGADAVGGVVNYITRKHYDGAQISVRYGFADDFNAADGGFIAGRKGERSSGYVAFNQSQRDEIYGRDRDYVRRLDWSTGLQMDRECSPGNVTIRSGSGVTNYALPGLAANTLNTCDASDDRSYYPAEEQTNVFGAYSYELTDRVTFDVRGWYTKRESESDAGPLRGSATVSPTNPFYRDTGDINSGLSQTVQFSLEPALGRSTIQEQQMEIWGLTPSLTIDLAHDWQMRALINYGESRTTVSNPTINTTALNNAARATSVDTAFHPYDVGATNPAVVAGIANYQEYGLGKTELGNARVAFDGPLLTLPGGDLRLAVGAEYIQEDFELATGFAEFGREGSLSSLTNDRDVKAFYGELNIPIVGMENHVRGIHSLTLSFSQRYDDYSDFGSTTNGKVGIEYEPVEWLTFMSTWSESFQAPALSTTLRDSRLTILPNYALLRDPSNPPPAPPFYEIFVSGGNPDLQPQEAETFTFGFDILPPALPGLYMSVDYYHVEFTSQIRAPDLFSPSLFQDYPELVKAFPAGSDVEALAALIPGGLAQVQNLAPGVPVYTLFDGRMTNLSSTEVDGIDFLVRYTHPTNFGSLFASVGGNYVLKEKSAPKEGLSLGPNEARFNKPRFKALGTFGMSSGNILAQASIKFLDDYDVQPGPDNTYQMEVASWWGLDLYGQYDFSQATGSLAGVSLSLRVENLLDRDPATYRGVLKSFEGYGNPFLSIGRQVQLGVTKKF